MNCKPGDLAYVIRSVPGKADGEPIEIIKAGTFLKVGLPAVFASIKNGRFMWHVSDVPRQKRALPTFTCSYTIEAVADKILQPLRPGDGEDEILRIAGRPNETPREVADLAPKRQVEHSR